VSVEIKRMALVDGSCLVANCFDAGGQEVCGSGISACLHLAITHEYVSKHSNSSFAELMI
jgi:hypothetical protein